VAVLATVKVRRSKDNLIISCTPNIKRKVNSRKNSKTWRYEPMQSLGQRTFNITD
jgi:hypothetical protein